MDAGRHFHCYRADRGRCRPARSHRPLVSRLRDPALRRLGVPPGAVGFCPDRAHVPRRLGSHDPGRPDLWAAPFAAVLGAQAWVAGFSVAIASAIGIGCAYWLARSLVGRGWGVACTLLVLAAPGFLVNTSSFMTDVPAFSAEIACLALGVAALRARGRMRWALLAASMAVGCAGFSVREFDLAAATAVLVSLALQDRRNWRTYSVFGACVLALCTAIYLWTWHLAGAQHEALGLPTASAVRALAGGYFALALFVSPFLPAAVRRSGPARSRRGLIAAAVILVSGAALLISGRSIFSGNYLTQQGMSGTATLPGFRPVLFPAPVWLVLKLIALAAGTVLAFMAANASCGVLRSWSTGRDGERSIISIFVALSGIGLVVYGLFVQGRSSTATCGLWPSRPRCCWPGPRWRPRPPPRRAPAPAPFTSGPLREGRLSWWPRSAWRW